MSNTVTTQPFIKLRVLVEADSVYNVFVARCLETGSVATADDLATAAAVMHELLDDEISYAVHRKNFANLFSSPAPMDVWVRWYEVTKKLKPEVVTRSIDARELRLDESEVNSEIAMVGVH